jgi:Phage integrase family
MSELYKPRNSPFWYYTITDQNGNRARCSTKTPNKQVAKAILRAAEQKVLLSGITSLRKAPTLGEFIPEFETWVQDHASLKPSTKRFYQCGVDLLKRSKLASLRVTAITNDDCVTTVFTGGAYNANKALRTLRSILTRAESRGLFPGKLPKITTRKVDRRGIHMTRAHCMLIASKMPECGSKDVLLILRDTGMRPNEAMSARWEYVDWLTRRYRVPSGKSEKAARVVPLLGESLVILKRRHLGSGNAPRRMDFSFRLERRPSCHNQESLRQSSRCCGTSKEDGSLLCSPRFSNRSCWRRIDGRGHATRRTLFCSNRDDLSAS